MASFETDLARYLADYDAAERMSEVERSMMDENSDYAVNGENATLIPASDVLDAEEVSVRMGQRGADFAIEFIPGCYMDRWCREGF